MNRAPALAVLVLPALPLALTAQGHSHDGEPHHHGHGNGLVTLSEVLSLPQNQPRRADRQDKAKPAAIRGQSGQGDFAFTVQVTSKALPKKVFAKNPFAGGKRTCLNCAHGGFAFDHRKGKGEVYWFLQGAGMMRIHKDRSKIELVKTDKEMIKFNMHNATFFVHHGEGRISWPANGGQRVFITDTDGKLLHTIGRPTVAPYKPAEGKKRGAGYAPTDTAYLDGLLWVSDGYASKYVMSYDLDKKAWTGTIFGGRAKKPEPGKFGTNHGITVHDGLLWIAGRYFARIHSYTPDTKFQNMFPLPDGSKPCDFEFFVQDGKLYGVACSLNVAKENKGDKGAAIYIVDMKTLKIVSTIKPNDELGLGKFHHLHNVFATLDDGVVTLFCQAWNGGDFAVLRQKRAE